MRRQHRVLQGIRGIVGVATGDLSQAVQLAVMPVEQLLEGIPLARDVRDEQLCVRPLWLSDSPEAPHRRTLINPAQRSRHFFAPTAHRRPNQAAGLPERIPRARREPGDNFGWRRQDAGLSVISEMAVSLLPSTVPSVVIHTSTFDTGCGLSMLMVLDPVFIGVGGLSAVVSSSVAGVAD